MILQPPTPQSGSEVGRGRSGVVYFEHGEQGPIVRKVFGGDRASRLVLLILTGAPNPYQWCEDAIAAATHRRRILQRLVRYWFDDRLFLPDTLGYAWNSEHGAYELRTGFVKGFHAPLRYDLPRGGDAIDELVNSIMIPLQRRLHESGFDGLQWQAGLGNPVAANNFMRVGGPNTRQWAWIDLESGVPALFPLNPWTLLRFYLPQSLRRWRALFDDVDVTRLCRYLNEHARDIESKLGADTCAQLQFESEQLAMRQDKWKRLPRAHRTIEYARVTRRIEPYEADFYRQHTWLWYVRLAVMGAEKALVMAFKAPGKLLHRLFSIPWGRRVKDIWRFCSSVRSRRMMAHRYVARRLGVWELRKHMSRTEAHRLRRELRHDETSEFITDFGVHLAIKPFVKTVEWLAFAYLVGIGMTTLAAVVVVCGGALGRTAYTSYRIAQHTTRGEKRPFVALVVGLFPVIGTFAYPIELAHRAEADHGLPRFLYYDGFARIGKNFPIWGGPDTRTEHYFNRLPDYIVALIRTAKPAALDTTPT